MRRNVIQAGGTAVMFPRRRSRFLCFAWAKVEVLGKRSRERWNVAFTADDGSRRTRVVSASCLVPVPIFRERMKTAWKEAQAA